MLWFIIYMTPDGWAIQHIQNPPPSIFEQVAYNPSRPDAAFFIKSIKLPGPPTDRAFTP